jgi:hypothetical protein
MAEQEKHHYFGRRRIEVVINRNELPLYFHEEELQGRAERSGNNGWTLYLNSEDSAAALREMLRTPGVEVFYSESTSASASRVLDVQYEERDE